MEDLMSMSGRMSSAVAVALWWVSSAIGGGVAMSGAASASGTDVPAKGKPQVFRTFAKVEIGQAGEIVSVVPEARLGADLGAGLEKTIRTLSFAPAAVNGQPVAGTTFVRMMGCAAALGSEQYRVAYAYESHGPGYSRMPHPAYPPNALRGGTEGDFDVQITVQPDGTARLVDVTATRGGDRAKKAFAESIAAWVSALRYEPETVDGKAVSTTLSIPLEYRLDPGPSPRKLRAEQQKVRSEHLQSDACQLAFGRERERRQEPIALNSPFGVKEGG
jgi:hypothetical protein